MTSLVGSRESEFSSWWWRSVAQLYLILLHPYGLKPTRLLCPWDFPGRYTGVGCHFLLQGISQPRDRTCVSRIGKRILYHWATLGSPLISVLPLIYYGTLDKSLLISEKPVGWGQPIQKEYLWEHNVCLKWPSKWFGVYERVLQFIGSYRKLPDMYTMLIFLTLDFTRRLKLWSYFERAKFKRLLMYFRRSGCFHHLGLTLIGHLIGERHGEEGERWKPPSRDRTELRKSTIGKTRKFIQPLWK